MQSDATEVNGTPPGGTVATIERPAAIDRATPVAIATTGSVTDLLRIAVERGTPVAELKELVALHEHMSKREAAKEFAAALAAFQAECPPIKKQSTAKIVTRTGGNYEFTYAEISDIARVVNPILARHGLSYGWDSTVDAGALTCVCTLRHAAGHSTTSSMTLPVENPSAMNPQQKVGAALTFAQRRTLSSVLGLTTTDSDPEGEADADPTRINDDQLTLITDLVAETATDLARYLKYLGVESLKDIRAAQYKTALTALENKRRKVQ